MNQVQDSGYRCPVQLRRILECMRRFCQVDFFGRPVFPVGLIIGEGKDAVHLTPDLARKVIANLEAKKGRQKSVDIPDEP